MYREIIIFTESQNPENLAAFWAAIVFLNNDCVLNFHLNGNVERLYVL